DLSDTRLSVDASRVMGVVELDDELGVALAEAAATKRSSPLGTRQLLCSDLTPKKRAHRFCDIHGRIPPRPLNVGDTRENAVFSGTQQKIGGDGTDVECRDR